MCMNMLCFYKSDLHMYKVSNALRNLDSQIKGPEGFKTAAIYRFIKFRMPNI